MKAKQADQSRTWLLGDLLGSAVIDAQGRVRGHIADLQISPQAPYTVLGLCYGKRGWSHRLHLPASFPGGKKSWNKADFVPWQAVERVEKGKVFLKENG